MSDEEPQNQEVEESFEQYKSSDAEARKRAEEELEAEQTRQFNMM